MTNTKNQQLAFDKFSELKVGALFMKMGTGKTKVAIDLVNYNDVDLLVYVCPFSTKDNIRDEIEKWGVNCEYILIGYETIQSSDKQYLDLLSKMRNKRCSIIADESVFIKNEETKRFNRLNELRKQCDYALILNGTPITKNEWDIYNQMYFLSPRIIDMSREQFLNTFFKRITYKKLHENPHTFYKFSEVNAEYLRKLIEPYIFECDLEFEKGEASNYKYIACEEDGYVQEKEQKLKEYANYGQSQTIINMLTSLNVISANSTEKNDELINYIRDKRVIVYCNFLSEIEYISERVDCFVVTGKIKKRKPLIEQFKASNKPLLMTLGVGSYSLNLQEFCNEIVYSSITFDYSKIEQSKYRIKRIGQEQDIKYTYFLTTFGINKLIIENLDRKQTLENLIKEKLKGGAEWLKSI
jgi:hypothetical protein